MAITFDVYNEIDVNQKSMHPIYGSSYMNRRKNMIMCANCGGLGHVYRTCNHPTISYGFICYRIVDNGKERYPVYLMVQRKDSLSYVEFMRGKYGLENKHYIMKLLSSMTEEERTRLRSNDFDKLWKDMWCKNDENDKNFNKEYVESRERFNRLRKGYYIKSNTTINFYNLDILLTNTIAEYPDTEWGFPKGRRNVNENDITCALREFKEETGINPRHLELHPELKPLEEIFSGSNKKRYKHVYYIAKYPDYFTFNDSKPSCREIKDVKWFSYDDAQNNIRDMNIERKELLKRIHHIITKSIEVK